MHAIVAGATGLVGSECLGALAGYESVTAFVRRASGIANEKVIDFDRLNELELPAGAHVFCALGTTIKKAGSQEAFRRVDFNYSRMLAERTAAAGGKFMLVSSVGADTKSRNFYLRVKGELEENIGTMGIEAAHIFRPSFLMGDRAEKRAGEKLAIAAARAIGPLLAGGFRKYRAIEASTVARAMVAAAKTSLAGTFVYHYDEIRNLLS
jgi:uncharacterized protein YbjT (DUF2867 family)